MYNIFQIGGQVTDGSFIGRKKILAKFKKTFLDDPLRSNKSIVGLPRTGKTSLIANTFINIPTDIIYIFINLNELSTYEEIWLDICYEISNFFKNKNLEFPEVEECIKSIENQPIIWIKMVRNIKNTFEKIAQNNYKVIIALDEFDNATDLFNGETKKFELFRTIFSDSQYTVSAIIISRRQLHTIEGTTYQSSTFHGIFDHIAFKGFDEEDMADYFQIFSDYGIILTDEQKDDIVYYAGNIPYLLSIIGHYIVETHESNEEINITEIFLNKCKAINDYYRSCIKYLEHDGNLKKIIPFIIGPNVGVTKNDKDELINLGYLQNDGEEFYAISKHFVSFLKANMVNISIWDSISNAEKMIRDLLNRELGNIIKHYQVGGKDINEIEKNVLSNILEITDADIKRYENFMKKNKEIYQKDSTYFEVLSIKDNIKIIKDCWYDIFQPYFNDTTYNEWQYKFNKIVNARNPIAHSHEEYLTDSDKIEIDAYCAEVFEVLKKNMGSIQTEEMSMEEILDYGKKHISTLNYLEPPENLIGKTVSFKIEECLKTVRGIVNEKYRGVIPKNYIKDGEFNNSRNQIIAVKVEKIENGICFLKKLC